MTTPVPMGCNHHGSCDVVDNSAMSSDPWNGKSFHQVMLY